MKCEKCQSANVIEGKLISQAGVVFRPKDEEKKLFPKYSPVSCYACLDCGHIFDLKITNIEKLKNKEDKNV